MVRAASALSPFRKSHGEAKRLTPIVVDLDGTLTPTDTLVESLVELAKTSPHSLLLLPLWLWQGRAALKQAVAARCKLQAERLPYRGSLLHYLRSEKEKGRQIVLATAADQSIAEAVAAHLDLFDEVIASGRRRNLKGKIKLDAVREQIGEEFVYAGNGRSDLSIWNGARAAILVAAGILLILGFSLGYIASHEF